MLRERGLECLARTVDGPIVSTMDLGWCAEASMYLEAAHSQDPDPKVDEVDACASSTRR